jgi:C4-dicarboxylate-specific signal transduction histidine kinase
VAQPLRRQLLIANLCFLVPIFFSISWAASLTYEEQVRQLQQETQSTAVTVVAFINRSLAGGDGVAAALALHPSVRTLDAAGLARTLPALLGSPLLGNVFAAAPDGRVIRWASPPEPRVESLLAPEWVRRVASEGRPLVSSLLTTEAHTFHALVFAYPVKEDESDVIAVVGLQVPLEAVENVLASIPLPAGSVVTVTDERGVVLARSHESARYVGRPVETPDRVQPLPEVPVTVVRTGVDGIERAFGNSLVGRGPWLVSVGIPTSVAVARTMPILWRMLSLAIAVTLFVAAVEFLTVRRYLFAFRGLERAAARVANGDLTSPTPEVMPSRELDRLQRSFSDMVYKLRHAHESIEAQVVEERRMREEVQSLQRQMIRQERLAAIGVLVSGVAHELNNPLQAILGFADLLHMRADLPANVRADLSLIQKESTRASAIIRNLSRFGYQQTSEPTRVRLHDVVASVVELMQRKLQDQGIALEVHESSVANVLAVFTELQQVLLNFLINAEQALAASPRGPARIVIRTSDDRHGSVVEVEDTGPGVTPEDEPRLFQPFFTTKAVGDGTGLGLSVSYGIIQSHGGTIGYRRGAWGGAVFYFRLPIASERPRTA